MRLLCRQDAGSTCAIKNRIQYTVKWDIYANNQFSRTKYLSACARHFCQKTVVHGHPLRRNSNVFDNLARASWLFKKWLERMCQRAISCIKIRGLPSLTNSFTESQVISVSGFMKYLIRAKIRYLICAEKNFERDFLSTVLTHLFTSKAATLYAVNAYKENSSLALNAIENGNYNYHFSSNCTHFTNCLLEIFLRCTNQTSERWLSRWRHRGLQRANRIVPFRCFCVLYESPYVFGNIRC